MVLLLQVKIILCEKADNHRTTVQAFSITLNAIASGSCAGQEQGSGASDGN